MCSATETAGALEWVVAALAVFHSIVFQDFVVYDYAYRGW